MITFKTLRENKNLTIEYVAEKLDVKPGTVKKYESSEKLPSNERFAMLQDTLECTDCEMATAFAYHKIKNVKVYSPRLKKNNKLKSKSK